MKFNDFVKLATPKGDKFWLVACATSLESGRDLMSHFFLVPGIKVQKRSPYDAQTSDYNVAISISPMNESRPMCGKKISTPNDNTLRNNYYLRCQRCRDMQNSATLIQREILGYNYVVDGYEISDANTRPVQGGDYETWKTLIRATYPD